MPHNGTTKLREVLHALRKPWQRKAVMAVILTLKSYARFKHSTVNSIYRKHTVNMRH